MTDIEFYKSVSGLSGLNDGQLGVLAGLVKVANYEDGHIFIEEGQSGDTAFLLIEGEVSVTRTKGTESRVKEINRMGPKEIFGVISLIDSKERTATCRARGKVKVAELSRDTFESLREQSSDIARHIQRIISRQISRDHKFFSNEIRDVIFSGNISDALKNQDGIIITDTYKGPDRRFAPSAEYSGDDRRTK